MINRVSKQDSQATVRSVQPGDLLVASPSISETHFAKTVVLVLQNNSDGTFGVILNRPAGKKIKHAWEQLIGSDVATPNVVHGGPINGPVFAVHQHPSIAEMEMPSGICVTSESTKFLDIVQHNELDYRIAFGVAGWDLGQLGSEIEAEKWLLLSGEAEHVFDDSDSLWENSLLRYSQQLLCDVVGLDYVPSNPLLN